MAAAKGTPELPLYRLYLLRAAFALIAFAQGARTWPAIIHHTQPWDFWHGVGASFLGALTLLSLVGIRYPVRMLPLMIFELAWKTVWTCAIWLPFVLNHGTDADIADNALSIVLGVVIVPIVIPWGYVWKNYFAAPGDRWR